MKKILAFLFLTFLTQTVFAQKQGNIWHFGPNGAGLDFNTCQPTVLTNGYNDPFNGMFEGSTTISDASGHLLFYSNGTSVFNANNAYMQNGSAVLSSSSNTLTQNIIIPKPGSTSLYYLFSPEVQSFSGPGAIMYSVIDMSLASGLGAVTSHGNILRDTIGRGCSEKLTAVRHANGQDIWLIGHDYFSNVFFAYLITASGINLVPVETSIGPVFTDPHNQSHFDAIGELKASPDGTKLGFTTFYTGVTAVFDFDKITGVVSNPVNLNITDGGTNTYAYGVSFSPDNSKFYVGVAIDSLSTFHQDLDQFDLSVWDSLSINGSRNIVYTVMSSSRFYSLKLGPDKKIYVAKSTGAHYLGVINFPNLSGTACNYVDNGIYLNGLDATWGLNNLMEMFDVCDSVTGINTTNESPIAIRAYPNPANDQIVIENIPEGNASLVITDILGQVVFSNNSVGQNTTVNTSEFAPGVYFINLVNENGDRQTVKFIRR